MKKQYKATRIICLLLVYLLAACNNNAPEPTPTAATMTPKQEQLWSDEPVLTATALAHEPYGHNSLYGSKEVPPIWWKRSPVSPQEGETVTVVAAAWDDNSDVWLEWTLNGEIQPPVPCEHTKNLKDGNIMKRRHEGALGSFAQGDEIEYLLRSETETLGPFAFTVTKWEQVISVSEQENGVMLCNTASLKIPLAITYPRDGTVCLSVNKQGQNASGGGDLTVHTRSDPFMFEIKDSSGKTVARAADGGGLRLLTDGKTVNGVELSLHAPEEQSFYGFGMRYDSLDQRGKDVDIYCVNWYTDQVRESYTPVPYYFVPDTYGLFLDSTAYSRFSAGKQKTDVCTVTVEDDSADFYFFAGDNAAIADGYTAVAGKPVLPPVWAFGPWISANEWDSQDKVMKQLEQTELHDIPTSVIVLEAWSDEETFYIWNDARYTPQDGNRAPVLSDFTFGERWYDPKGMTNAIHDAGMKLLLWQIPVLRHSVYGNAQLTRDINYAQREGYVIRNADGSPYRMPRDTWFGNSLLVDFSNPAASRWFLDKRRYLLDELGIDGFKTDGGEFVWGKGTNAHNGLSGISLRNAYPDLYAQAYFDYAREIVPDALTFSRAGGAAMQNHPICWIGDQRSTPEAFKDAIQATLSTSMSGIPFVAWDVAGFSGDVPSTELYLRSVAQAAFSPIMQIHSETNSGGTPPSQARTPWNMAERKKNDACLETYRYYANLRMNLLPYIYSEARHSSLTGEPLMRSMAYAFPNDSEALKYEFQYMLGSSLLVAPVTDVRKTTTEVYLPSGMWYDLFSGREYGAGIHQIDCAVDEIPVFVKSGSVIPMNLGESRELGGSVGNNTEAYTNLTFFVYPGARTTRWHDYVHDTEVTVTVDGNGSVSASGISQDYDVIFVTS